MCRYSRFENNREMSLRGRDALGAAAGAAAVGEASVSLIDLNDKATAPVAQLAGLSKFILFRLR